MTAENSGSRSPASGPADTPRPSAAFSPTLVVTPSFMAQKPPPPAEAAEPKPESAAELLARLRRLHAEGRVTVDLDVKRLMHIDSPVAFEADSNQWIYGLLALTALLWYVFGYRVGLGVAAASIVLYLSVGKMMLRQRIAKRVRGRAMDDEAHWRRLWDFGGVTLRQVTGGDSRCVAPAGNWMEFVRRLSAR